MMSNSKEKRSLSPKSAAIRGISALLACVVLFFTFHALTRPAITLEGQVCPLQEHVHTEACYETPETPSDAPAHTHTDECYAPARGELICGLEEGEEHQHTDDCYATVRGELICELEETAPAAPKLICGLEEHTHSEACQSTPAPSEEDQARVNEVIALIDALPTSEDVETTLTELEAAEDEEEYNAYFEDVRNRCVPVYIYYQALEPQQQESVINRDKLLALDWLWSSTTYATTDTVNVTAVNSHSYSATIIYHSDDGMKVGDNTSGEKNYAYWTAIVVEYKNGKYVVTQISPADGNSKSSLSASGTGFILLYHENNVSANVNVSVGDTVTLSSDFWKTKHSYSGTVFGTVTFSPSTSSSPKPEKNNILSTVQSADTNGLIEVNLYDYGSNINDLYNNNP
ncbi:MAG: hypothetical protein ACI4XW_02560, partial [Candidatus Spyradocola sp.]